MHPRCSRSQLMTDEGASVGFPYASSYIWYWLQVTDILIFHCDCKSRRWLYSNRRTPLCVPIWSRTLTKTPNHSCCRCNLNCNNFVAWTRYFEGICMWIVDDWKFPANEKIQKRHWWVTQWPLHLFWQHTFGWIGKQHHNTKAMNATIVPISKIKSSIVCEWEKNKCLDAKFGIAFTSANIEYYRLFA